MRAQFFAALVLAAALAACGGAEQRKAEHTQKAMALFEQGNFEKAAVEFKNVLQIDPKTAAPYYYLGRIEESKKNWREAFGLYQKAVETDPNYRDAQFKLAQFLALSREPEKAAEMLAPVAKERPADLDVRLLQVAIANLRGDTAASFKALQAIVGEKPAKLDPYLALAALYAEKSDKAAAEATLKAGLAANPHSPALLATLAQLYQQQKDWEKAEQAVRELIAAEPKQFGHRVLLVDLYVNQSRWDEAEKALRANLADFPEETKAPLMLADYLVRRGEPARAEAELRASALAHPGKLDFHSALAKLLEALKKPEQSEQVFRDFISRSESKPDILKAKESLAELLSRTGKTGQGETLVDEVLAESPQDHAALLLKGKLALARKNAQDAISAFRSILKDQPDAADVLTLLAVAYQDDGKPALVQENLERAVRAKPNDYGLRRNLVEFLLRQKSPSQALEQADDFIKAQPKSFEALNLKADVLAKHKEADALEPLLKEIAAAFPDKPAAAFRLGNFYYNHKRYDAALAEYEAALKRAPGAYEILQAYTGTCLELKQPGKALAKLKQVLADNPKHAGAYQLTGVVNLAEKREAEGVKALSQAIETDPRWMGAYASLGMHYEREKKPELAVAVYRKALAAVPGEAGMQLNLARAYEGAKQFDQAVPLYEELLKAHPDLMLATNNLASLLSVNMAGEANLKRAAELGRRLESSQEPAFQDTLAWIYHLSGEEEKARPLALQAVEKLPKVPVFQYHLGMIYAKQGDAVKAKEHLAKAVEPGADFPGSAEARATLQSLR